MDRPRADELQPIMLVGGKAKLAAHAKPYAAELRCPKRHLLAATVRTTHGPWVLWRGNMFGQPWRSAWLDEIPDPAALPTRCQPCGMVWFLDVTDPTLPRCNKPASVR